MSKFQPSFTTPRLRPGTPPPVPPKDDAVVRSHKGNVAATANGLVSDEDVAAAFKPAEMLFAETAAGKDEVETVKKDIARLKAEIAALEAQHEAVLMLIAKKREELLE
ncbi:hypothetical protein LTR85_005237 [Meristemomyces frigidus]|nr:hypothetical protein LTR85_005237 [Meristemomyces frigidus]